MPVYMANFGGGAGLRGDCINLKVTRSGGDNDFFFQYVVARTGSLIILVGKRL